MDLTLEQFKKANKERRNKIALKLGYKDASELLNLLKGEAIKTKQNPVVKKAVRNKVGKIVSIPTIHNIHILDASSSMDLYGKIKRATEGINAEVEALRDDKTINYLQSIISFSAYGDMVWHNRDEAIKNVQPLYIMSRTSTALYHTVGTVLEQFLKESNGVDKYLVKIFTDGQENDSQGSIYRKPGVLAKLIKEAEGKGFTVTFVGTKDDVASVTAFLHLDESNTLIHDNTAKGVQSSYGQTIASTFSYSANLKSGKDVTRGFYKKVGKL